MNAPRRSLFFRRAMLALWLILVTTACARSPKQAVLTADMPLHLEDHLDAAKFTELSATDLPKASLPKPVEWRFDQPQPDWKATPLWTPPYGAPVVARTGDGLRITLTNRSRLAGGLLRGAIRIDLPDWDRNDWAEVIIHARADRASSVNVLGLGFNLREGRGDAGAAPAPPFQFGGEESGVVRDDAVRLYRFRINVGGGLFQGPWRQLLLYVGSSGAPGSIDILSVTVVPKGATPVPTTVEWRFDQAQPDWKAAPQLRTGSPTLQPAEIMPARTNDALRVTLTESSRQEDKLLAAGIYVDLPGWRREEWAHVIVRARTSSATSMTIGLNPGADLPRPTYARGRSTPIVSDGSVQTYQIRPNWGEARTGPWVRVGLYFRASEPGSIDILSVSVIPIANLYAGDRAGVQSIAVAGANYRRSVFVHAPGRLEYTVRVPEGGRLHAALGVLDVPVEFRVTAQPANGEAATVFRATHADPEQWADRTVDLSAFAGQTITLGLETGAAGDRSTVAFWGAPTLSGARRTDKPNVIFYVIDGGGADYMSVYGYNRRTTPNLEKLAAEGAVFEHAYSNSTLTRYSTPSFMTSLQSSVLGSPLPDNATTMAERFHAAGYQTGVFTSNPWAASATQLGRGVDALEDTIAGTHGPAAYVGRGPDSSSSRVLNEVFWRWQEAYAAQPYWVHVQTTDVHAPYTPVPPFAGLFVSPEQRNVLENWNERLGRNRLGGGINAYSPAFQTAGIDRVAYFTAMQGIYDEMMALNDYQIGRLVDRLKATGEWQHTLLVVAADHGIGPAMDADMGIATLGELPPGWANGAPMFRPSLSHVPLLVVWPGHIAGGQRFQEPVSMIDLLPTVLDLVGFPMPEIMQGQSLAPLLRGQPGWTARPVILDQLGRNDATGEWGGHLEVVDGRWGASMRIGPPLSDPAGRRPWPVLLFDLWNDPLCVSPVNEREKDLVDKYTKFLTDQWKAHQALAKQFKPGPKTALTPEQLERLRSLGYIR